MLKKTNKADYMTGMGVDADAKKLPKVETSQKSVAGKRPLMKVKGFTSTPIQRYSGFNELNNN